MKKRDRDLCHVGFIFTQVVEENHSELVDDGAMKKNKQHNMKVWGVGA